MRAYHLYHIHPARHRCTIGTQNMIALAQPGALCHAVRSHTANDGQDCRLIHMQAQFIEKIAIQIFRFQAAHIQRM